MSIFGDEEFIESMFTEPQMQNSQALFSKKPVALPDNYKLSDKNINELMYRHRDVLIYKGSIVVVAGRRIISNERLVLSGDIIASYGKTGLRVYIYNDQHKLQDSDVFPSYIELSRGFLENSKPEEVKSMTTGKIEYLPVYMTYRKPISTKQMLIDIGELNAPSTTTKKISNPQSHYANFNDLAD